MLIFSFPRCWTITEAQFCAHLRMFPEGFHRVGETQSECTGPGRTKMGDVSWATTFISLLPPDYGDNVTRCLRFLPPLQWKEPLSGKPKQLLSVLSGSSSIFAIFWWFHACTKWILVAFSIRFSLSQALLCWNPLLSKAPSSCPVLLLSMTHIHVHCSSCHSSEWA